ncbi:hypothetical protein AKJ16_DCAP08542 [Drosera capensis]
MESVKGEGSGLVGKSAVDRAKAATKRDLGRVRDATRVSGLGIVGWTRRGVISGHRSSLYPLFLIPVT